jgi:hypothetical protein
MDDIESTPKSMPSLLEQIIEVYGLWRKAMLGDWQIYFKYFAYTVDQHEPDENLRMAKPLINDEGDSAWILRFLCLIFEDNNPIKHIVKSRQQRVSHIMTHVCLYMGMTHSNWLIPLQSTKKINKVDELFEKQRNAYNRLPPWKMAMKENKRDGISTISNGTKFIMFSQDTDDSAGYTFNFFYFDEASLHKKGKKVFGVCLPGLDIGQDSNHDRMFVSSSSPRLDSYHVQLSIEEFVESSRSWIIRRKWSGKGLSTGLNKRGHQIIELHYSANPNKDKQWVSRTKPNFEPDTWEREYELNPDAIEGDKVFKSFDISMIKANIHLDHDLVLLRGWDFGKRAAVTWSQYDFRAKQYRILREMLQDYSDADRTVIGVDAVTEKLLSANRGFNKYIMDYCDPYQGSQSDYLTGVVTMEWVEKRMWDVCRKKIRFFTVRRIKVPDRIETCRAVMRQGFIIDSSCTELIKGFRGAYVMKPKDNKPNKDGWYDHLMDAMGYPIIAIFTISSEDGLIYLSENTVPIDNFSSILMEREDIIEGLNIVEHKIPV